MWYRADFNITSVEKDEYSKFIGESTDSEWFESENDDDAKKYADELAEQGEDYSDIGHCELELSYLAEVDGDTECFVEKRVIYY